MENFQIMELLLLEHKSSQMHLRYSNSQYNKPPREMKDLENLIRNCDVSGN